jgi:EAL domain-containing protein (putative c-di-GMP-specific phosphodiesterase class I)
VGIAVFPNDGDTADVLLRNAEAAHKKCKSSGDRYLFYQPEMNAKVAETLLLESKLRTALEQHQFILHYQPKITAEDGRISGIEALIRWNDPDNGLVLPAKFIPVLEETGMILEVGQWVIRQALAHHSLWMAEGLEPPRIAVNVSAAQVRQKDFVNMVRRALGGITSDALEFEITESVVMHDIEDIIKKLQSLRDMGINISIDDFGTGYSSLTYLARLPINTVKIDRSFVANMTTDANSMTMVSAILSLAHSLKLRVVAEGVETEDQARLLRLLRCDEWQGHLFGKPVSQKEIVHFFIPPKANNATRLDTNAAKLNSTAAVSNPITKTRG